MGLKWKYHTHILSSQKTFFQYLILFLASYIYDIQKKETYDKTKND